MLCGYFEHQRRVQFGRCVAEPLQTITAILPGSKWRCFLLRIVLQDALSEVTKKCPPLKLRVFVDDITALLKGRNKEVVQMAEKVLGKLKKEVKEKGLKVRATLRRANIWKKSSGIKKKEWHWQNSVETQTVDPRTQTSRIGSFRKST